ncbi:SIR2 family protein [Kribbella endophytica]
MSAGGIVLLLGAGASVEAGLPASFDLTEKITKSIEGDRYSRMIGLPHALHFAIGSLVAHDTARGGSAFDGIDVERLFSAVQMLSDRGSLEIAPFVASWSAGLTAITGSNPYSLRRSVESLRREFFTARPSDARMAEIFARAVDESSSDTKADAVYSHLQDKMVEVLQGCLTLDGSTVDYLSPLLSINRERPLRIATLNYDRSIELLCARAGKEVATGVTLWSGGYDWDWEAGADVHLLKLHGSIDWILGKNRPDEDRLPDERIVVGPPPPGELTHGARPGVVFGQRDKLRSDGPFLAMLREFDQLLHDADHLVIIGYSYRDAHINAALRRWYNNCEDPRLTLIDLKLFGSWSSEYEVKLPYSNDSFIDSLLGAISGSPVEGSDANSLRGHHRILRLGTGEALAKLFGPGPELMSVADLRSAISSTGD